VAIEKVQKRFTKRLVGLTSLPYTEHLKITQLILELRRLHNDLLWCYKIVYGLVDITCDDFFQLCTSSSCINLVQARLEAVSLLAVLSTVGIVYHHPLILAALMLLSDL